MEKRKKETFKKGKGTLASVRMKKRLKSFLKQYPDGQSSGNSGQQTAKASEKDRY